MIPSPHQEQSAIGDSAPTRADPIRRPFQFRLRSLLIAMIVLGTLLGVVAVQIGRYESQRRVARDIEALGGAVGWSWTGNVTSVHMVGAAITDDDLKLLEKLPRLEVLWVAATPITDGAVSHIKELRRLRLVSVGGTKMSPSGVARLRSALPEATIVDIGIGTSTGKRQQERLISGDRRP